MKTCVLASDGFEEVEAMVTLDWLRRAGVETVFAGLDARVLHGARGVVVECDATLGELDAADFGCLALPGGLANAERLAASAAARRFAEAVDARGGVIAAICATPALALGKSWGMLRGRRWTCYPGMEAGIEDGVHVDWPAVRDGNLVTGRSAGTASEFALLLVEAIAGREAAAKVRAAIAE